MRKFIPICALILILLPLLTGCFQQAGEAYQPASSTEVPITVPNNTDNTGNPTLPSIDVPALTSFPATATLPEIDITVIAPTRIIGGTTPTPPVAAPPTLEGGIPVTDTETFHTPSSPLGPVPQDTPMPTLPGGTLTATPSGLITPTALPGIGVETTAGGECTYTIQSGDTLFRIAVRHNTTVNDITAANPGINPNLIQPGQVIQLPGCTPGASSTVGEPTTPPETSGNPPATGGTTYTVKSGDTLFSIAQHFGVTVQAIVNANNLSNPNNLSVGQQLIIPQGS